MNDRIEQILTEILETQREHLEMYRRVTAESLQVQRQAVESQARHILMYRRVAAAGGLLILALLGLILWLVLSFF